jgi:hypothetical protein
MARLITVSFAIIGVVAGFVAGLLAGRALGWHDGDKAKVMAFAFAGSFAFAALFGWAASRVRAVIPKQRHGLLGFAGLVLALASLAWIFRSIK